MYIVGANKGVFIASPNIWATITYGSGTAVEIVAGVQAFLLREIVAVGERLEPVDEVHRLGVVMRGSGGVWESRSGPLRLSDLMLFHDKRIR